MATMGGVDVQQNAGEQVVESGDDMQPRSERQLPCTTIRGREK